MAQDPKVGDRLINEHGTCVKIVKAIDGDETKPGEIGADRADDFLKAGYRIVTDDDVIPVQQHQIDADR